MSIFSFSVWPHPSKIYSRSVVKNTLLSGSKRENTHGERWKFAGKHHHTCILSLFHCQTHHTHTHTHMNTPGEKTRCKYSPPISKLLTFIFIFLLKPDAAFISRHLAVCAWQQSLGATQPLHWALLHSRTRLNTLWQVDVVAFSGYRSLPLKKLWEVVIWKRYNRRTSS